LRLASEGWAARPQILMWRGVVEASTNQIH